MASGTRAALIGRTHGRTDQFCYVAKKPSPTRSGPHMTQSGHHLRRLVVLSTGRHVSLHGTNRSEG
jgi:hypothetical protein